MMNAKQWAKLLNEGEALDKEEGDLAWKWGDLMVRVAPPQGHGGLREAGESIQDRISKYVADLGERGVERRAGTLMEYREIAAAWPSPGRPGLGYEVARALAYQPDRADLAKHKFTVKSAREFVGIRSWKSELNLNQYVAFCDARDEDPTLTAEAFFGEKVSEVGRKLEAFFSQAEHIEVPAGSLDDLNLKQQRYLPRYMKATRKLLATVDAELAKRESQVA